jgi:hypothetical protein
MSGIMRISAYLEGFSSVTRKDDIEQKPELSFGMLLKLSVCLLSQAWIEISIDSNT